MEKVLLISDLDKTLLDNNARVPQQCLDAIAAFTAQGGLFSVCTGRPTRGALMYSQLVGLINTPIISYSGACIYDTKTHHALWQDFLPGETEDVFCAALDLFPRIGLAIYRGEDDLTCTIHPNEYTDELLWKRESYRAETCTLDSFPKPWNKCVLTGPEEDMAKCTEFIRENTPCPITAVLSEKIFLEINGPGIVKGANLADMYFSLRPYGDGTYKPVYDLVHAVQETRIGSEELHTGLIRVSAGLIVNLRQKDNAVFNSNVKSVKVQIGGIAEKLNFYTAEPVNQTKTVRFDLSRSEDNTTMSNATVMLFPSAPNPTLELYITLADNSIHKLTQTLNSSLSANTLLTLNVVIGEILPEGNPGDFTITDWNEESETIEFPTVE